MKFCPDCSRIMERDTNSTTIKFKCKCGKSVPGNVYDARIAGEVLRAGNTEIMYKKLMESAAHDPVNKIVTRDCPDCGRDYMTQIYVGDRKIIVWLCKCGHNSSRH